MYPPYRPPERAPLFARSSAPRPPRASHRTERSYRPARDQTPSAPQSLAGPRTRPAPLPAAPARTQTPPPCRRPPPRAPAGRRQEVPAGLSPTQRRAQQNAILLAAVQVTNSTPGSATTSPTRRASHPAPRSTSSAFSDSPLGTTTQKPTPRLKTPRISSSAIPPTARIKPKTRVSSQVEGYRRAPKPPR